MEGWTFTKFGITLSATNIAFFLLLQVILLAGFAWIRPPSVNGAEGSETESRGIWRLFAEFPFAIMLFGLLALLLGISLKDHGWADFALDKEFFGNVFAELGVALLIAYFISISIESYSRETHNRHVQAQIDIIKRSVFESVYKARYDKNFVNFIEDNIFKYPFFRKKYRLAIKISPHDSVASRPFLSPEDPVVASITMRYVIENITNNSRQHLVHTYIEKRSVRVGKDPTLSSYRDGNKVQQFANDDEFRAFGGTIAITDEYKIYSLPTSFLPNEQKSIEIKYDIVKFARDEMPWSCVDPAEDFLLMLTHGEQLQSDAAPIHSRQDIVPRRGIGGIDLELEIPEPLFPYNGVHVWWRPRPDPSSPGIVPEAVPDRSN